MDKRDVNRLFGNLSPDQQKQVKGILADKNKTEEILRTPEAQALLKKLMLKVP